MRLNTPTRCTHEVEEQLIDLRGLDAADTETYVRDGIQEAGQED